MSTDEKAGASIAAARATHRWAVLAVLGIAQLMVVLDATIVNVALPDAQADLGFGPEDRQWVITAYAVAFGSLLLLGGRLSDRWGQRTTLLTGLVGFAAASTVGGAASSFEMLIAARAAQGMFAAILAPAALSLLTVTFTDPRERNAALGVFGAVSGAGAAVGLILGGALTQYLDWSWCLYVNDAFAVVAAVGAVALIPGRGPTVTVPLDLPGTLTASAGVLSLVYGFARAEGDGWTSPTPVALVAVGVALLGTFSWLERRVAHPLLPLRIVLDPARGGSLIALAWPTSASSRCSSSSLSSSSMDDHGVDVAVLSLASPGVQNLPAAEAVAVAREANDALAEVVASNPERFQAFAAIPTPDPDAAAAAELEHAVTQLGFRGAMLYGRTGDTLADAPDFDDLYATAERLRVPLHFHPQTPVKADRATHGVAGPP